MSTFPLVNLWTQTAAPVQATSYDVPEEVLLIVYAVFYWLQRIVSTQIRLSGACPSCAIHLQSVTSIFVKTARKDESSGLQA